MKRLTALTILLVVVLSILCLAKYPDGELALAVNGSILTLKVANLPLLNSGEYPLDIENIFMITSLVFLTFFRSWLLKLTWK